MALRIVTADERLPQPRGKTTMAIFGPSGVGKTSLLKTLPPEETLCIDLEAGMKSVQDWPGDSIPVRTFADALDIACLVGGVNPAADPTGFFSEGHYRHLSQTYPDLVRMIAGKRIIFVDSITDLTRQAMAWAKTRPEAFSDKTGKPDTRGAYGLLAREVIGLLKHLQHAPGQDGDLRRHPRTRDRRVQPRHLAAADGRRQGRPRAPRHRRPGHLDELLRRRRRRLAA